MEYDATLAADSLGLTYAHFNYLMGIAGLFVGLVVAFGLMLIFSRS